MKCSTSSTEARVELINKGKREGIECKSKRYLCPQRPPCSASMSCIGRFTTNQMCTYILCNGLTYTHTPAMVSP